MNDERTIWRTGNVECVMVSCCSGAELQIRRVGAETDGEILLRELYPMKSDLYERARELESEYGPQS
jgi:hypothetical protein